MIALLDVGNSRIKWAWLSGGVLRVGRPLPRSGDWRRELAEAWDGAPPPCRVVVSNVAGNTFADDLQSWLRERYDLAAEFAAPLVQGYGVRNGYREPQRLGVDRWLALVALRKRGPLPACVLDAGTAATFDLLDANGVHLGGAIAPGLRLMAETLTANTAQICSAEAGQAAGLGDHTAAAIRCGAINALAGMAERLRQQAAITLGQSPAAVLTGGDGPMLVPHLEADWHWVPDLVLQGLAVLTEYDL